MIINILERYLHSYISNYLSFIRTLFYEFSRITNHLLAITTHAIDIGSLNSMLLAFEEREKILALHEYIAGSRIHSSLLSIFTIRYDISFRFIIYLFDLLINFPSVMKEMNSILSYSSIFISRLYMIGIVDFDTVMICAISGVLFRSVGINVDYRMIYYHYLHHCIIIGVIGDCLDRYQLRMNELYQSIIIC